MMRPRPPDPFETCARHFRSERLYAKIDVEEAARTRLEVGDHRKMRVERGEERDDERRD